jgi:galacturan 1,4-alpha-galacturonidase
MTAITVVTLFSPRIGTALNLTFLNEIDLDIQGTIQFTNDTDYWQKNGFYQTFQNATTFFQLGGHDVNVYGGGTLDGNGQAWYDLYAKDIYILRPILFGTIGLHGGRIEDLKFRYSPQWYTLVANSTDVVFSNIDIEGGSVSKNPAKNTDGYAHFFPLNSSQHHILNISQMGHIPLQQHRHSELQHQQRR